MLVPMMLVVQVCVRVLRERGRVLMFVALRKMQPHTDRHARRSDPERQRRSIMKSEDRQRCADERRGREVGSGPRRSKMSESEHEQNETQTVAEESKQQRPGKYWKR